MMDESQEPTDPQPQRPDPEQTGSDEPQPRRPDPGKPEIEYRGDGEAELSVFDETGRREYQSLLIRDGRRRP